MPLYKQEVSPLTLEQALAVIGRGGERHMTTDLAGEKDLDVLEEALGHRLPEDFRTLLARLGGGIFYGRDELFGARRLMIHDIELVPDLLSFRRLLARRGDRNVERGLVPFHRAANRIHFLDPRAGSPALVVSADGARSFPDLASFLEQVVIPTGDADEP